MAANRKKINIPRQLVLLVGIATIGTASAAALYYFTSIKTSENAAALTTATVAKLDGSYNLLERISSDMSNLQALLRLDDPDVIEKTVARLQASQQQSAALITACGDSGAPVKAEFDSLIAGEKSVIDQFVKGQNALAYEKFLREVSPRSAAVFSEIRKYHEAVQKTAQQAQAAGQLQMRSQLHWRLATLGVVLVVVMSAGWRLKRRITMELLAIASQLGKVSQSSASASSQVSAASQSLAEGSSEQAASLEQTSASLEELSSITKRNAENAQKANDLARQTRQAADQGVIDMQAMSAAMQAIKGSSDEVAKIIKTIDEIAFQTNILALNAAVEAARAGEAGMGFAVVADEVRNLAQRSAHAAKETAAKIEHAIGNTAEGVNLSNQVAQSLNQIVTRARQVDELASEVAGASQEQTQGIAQINIAVSQVDKVTQSNAASAEETAAAAEELNAQSALMEQAVTELVYLVGASSGGSDTQAQRPDFPSEEPSTSFSSSGVIAWNDAQMSTGVKSVDEEHQELIRLINDLHAACVRGTATENLMLQLEFLGKYASSHFGSEEDIMNRHRCPAAGANKVAHTQFLHDYEKLMASARSGGASTKLAIQLKKILADWLKMHICKIDTQLRDCHPAEPFKTSITKAEFNQREIRPLGF